MKKLLYLLGLLLSFGGCQPQATPAPSDELVGSWRLTNLQCYCPAGWLPDEQLLLEANRRYQLYQGGQLKSAGSYATSQGSLCGQGTSKTLLRLTPDSTGAYTRNGSYTLQANRLIIDQGSECLADAPVATYKRQ
ncbi:MAG: hypothetical protein ACRYFK_17005 [Janthinobacterium lividum]